MTSNVSTAGNEETPKVLQIVPAPAGLHALYTGQWQPSRTAGYEVREVWNERIDCLALCEWPDGERNVYPISVSTEGVSWHWSADWLTTDELDEDDKFESRKVRTSS